MVVHGSPPGAQGLTLFGGGAGDARKVVVHVLLLRRELAAARGQRARQRAREAPVHEGLVEVLLPRLARIGAQLHGMSDNSELPSVKYTHDCESLASTLHTRAQCSPKMHLSCLHGTLHTYLPLGSPSTQ